MAYIGISSKEIAHHPEWHPRLLYDELSELAIADIRRRIALGARAVVVEVVEEPDETWVWRDVHYANGKLTKSKVF